MLPLLLLIIYHCEAVKPILWGPSCPHPYILAPRGQTGRRGPTQGGRTCRVAPWSCHQNPAIQGFFHHHPSRATGVEGPCPAGMCYSGVAIVLCCYLSLLEEAAAGVKGIDVYFDNEFSMRLQTNKINSLGCIFNSQLYCGETSLVADG